MKVRYPNLPTTKLDLFLSFVARMERSVIRDKLSQTQAHNSDFGERIS